MANFYNQALKLFFKNTKGVSKIGIILKPCDRLAHKFAISERGAVHRHQSVG